MESAAKHKKLYEGHSESVNQAGSLDHVREPVTYGCEGEHVYGKSVHCR
jgi:hypothetical protein